MNKTDLSQQLRDMFAAMDPKNINNIEDWIIDDVDYSNRNKRVAAPRATFADDPLALSCASYRIYRNEPARRFTNIDLVKATAEDREHAQAIRDYYNARYTMKALRGGVLTEYQQKAAQFLSGLYHLTADELGMLYKLPYFYDEDRAHDDIVAETQSCDNPETLVARSEESLTLVPLKRVLITRKGASDFVHYYYLDQDQHAVMIMCPATDRLQPMMEGLFRQPRIRVRGYAFSADIGESSPHYVKKLSRWELVF